MSNIYYEGTVPMKPEMKKKDFLSCDAFSYHIPKIYFECAGETYDPRSSFEWSENSLLIVKDNCVVKYTEMKINDVLVVDEDGQKHWLENITAIIRGFGDGDIEESKERKQYTVEEYDLEKFEKKTYRVVLEEVSQMDDSDEYYIKKAIKSDKEKDNTEYSLTE